MRTLLPDASSQHSRTPDAKRLRRRPTGFVNYLSRRINALSTMAKKIERKTDIRAAPAKPAT